MKGKRIVSITTRWTLLDKIWLTKQREFHKYFYVFLLISFLFFAVPAHGSVSPNKMFLGPNHKLAVRNDQEPKQYAVIFDAGSSGSRVHVYCFDQSLNLLPIVGDDLELFIQTKPGLSAYANDPKAAANSLLFLLEEAENVIPKELRPVTPVKVGATAGLRQLKRDASDKILQAVRDLLKNKSTLKYNADWVTFLEGTEEASYQWVTVNYLLGNLGENYSNSVGVVDLGGGSVQMAYAISEEAAAKAPKTSDGDDTYVKEMYLKGKNYYLYAHSYLNYGLLAARAEILNATGSSGNPCILAGYSGSYKYNGVVYEASASPSGPSMHKCREVVLEALKVNARCTYTECTFNGIWNGGGGDGQKNLYVASFFFDKASQTGLINPSLPTAKVRPLDFGKAAERACKTGINDAGSIYPRVEMNDIPYICMDLVYQITLLVDGFGLDPWQEITLVKQVEYQNHLVEAAWPLGSAIDAVSSLTQAQTA